jgi:hypothetical protein
MAPKKSKNKSAEGEKSTSFALDVSDGDKDQESEEEQSAGRFKDPRSRPVSFALKIKSRAHSVIGLNLREDPSFDARHVLGPREDVYDVERRWQDEEGEGFSPGAGWMAKIVAEVSSSIKDEVRDIVATSQRESTISLKDLEGVKAAQRVTDLQSESARLISKGAQLQYLAFAKIRARVSNAICLLKTHDTLGAINALERIEKVVDLHLDVVKKAGFAPGMWPVATLYKKIKLAETSDAKNDKVWPNALAKRMRSKPGQRLKSARRGHRQMQREVLPSSSAATHQEATSPFDVRPIIQGQGC